MHRLTTNNQNTLKERYDEIGGAENEAWSKRYGAEWTNRSKLMSEPGFSPPFSYINRLNISDGNMVTNNYALNPSFEPFRKADVLQGLLRMHADDPGTQSTLNLSYGNHVVTDSAIFKDPSIMDYSLLNPPAGFRNPDFDKIGLFTGSRELTWENRLTEPLTIYVKAEYNRKSGAVCDRS
jgi:hypothetical protein